MIEEIEAKGSTLSAYKEAIASTRETLAALFKNGAPVAELIGWQSAITDSIITHSWQRTIPASARDSIALVAVGGYGRAELHPRSDIDILILTTKNFTAADEEIGSFVTHLWDLGKRQFVLKKYGRLINSLPPSCRNKEKDILNFTVPHFAWSRI